MSLLESVTRGVQGDQIPRILSSPPRISSSGAEVVELAAMAGLVLDPWQQLVLDEAMGERADGKWAAFEVGLVVSRQNGKGSILEARELGGLFLLDEKMLVHSAHQFDTSLEAFKRLLELIEGTDEFLRRVKRVSRSHGEEGIELYGPSGARRTGGQRIRFRTRTRGGGRGFSGNLVIMDEAMKLPEATIGALMPILSAQPNPQIWYTGSAVDQLNEPDGRVLSKLRSRGLAGGDPSLAYMEWSIDCDTPDDLDAGTALSEEAWAQANPSLSIRITPEYVGNEQRSMDARTFAVERLAVGDWPRTDGASSVIDLNAWDDLVDPSSVVLDPVWFAIDVKPDRSRASIASVGMRADGAYHVELVDRQTGTDWIAKRAAELQSSHRPRGFLADAKGPIASLLPEILDAGVRIETIEAQEYAKACGFTLDVVRRGTLRHLGQNEVRAAIRGAATRTLGDAWAWSRRGSTVDISPLVAISLGLWGWSTAMAPPPIVMYG